MAENKSIEVTEEMIRAGVDYFIRCTEDRFPESWPSDLFVMGLFAAMQDARLPQLIGRASHENIPEASAPDQETVYRNLQAAAASAPSRTDLASDDC